jgi:hypothetical protein
MVDEHLGHPPFLLATQAEPAASQMPDRLAALGAAPRRYTMAAMAVDTATIRVARDTRDLLSEQARERGISLSALLAEIARERARETTFASERQAIRADAENPAALEEMDLWETTLSDGIG